MASRREFLQAGIAASMLPLAASAAIDPAGQPNAEALPFYKVIFDERFPASVAFGGRMKRQGAAVHAIQGDITDLWFHDLDARWKQGPAAIAGMTAHGALFCLERLAWDHGMRVVYRLEHAASPDSLAEDALISWVIAPKGKNYSV
jgi:hypothetical protein